MLFIFINNVNSSKKKAS